MDYISRQEARDALWQERVMLDSLMDEYLIKGMPIMRSNAKIERNRVDNDIFIIDQLPAAPVREVVLCKDCKHHWTHKCMDSMPIEECDLGQTFYDAEVDYCSLAERRQDG